MDFKEKKRVKPIQAIAMLLTGIAIIIIGLLVLKANNRIVLAADGIVMCVMAVCFGISYQDLAVDRKSVV